MKRIKQTDIAGFLGVSPQSICDLRKNRRLLSKKRALRISAKTGIPFDVLALTNGDELYKKLVFAYSQTMEAEK